MQELIRGVLERESVGSISPADNQTMSLLRSVRNTALRGFRFDPPVMSGSTKFPTNDEYEKTLSKDSMAVLRSLMSMRRERNSIIQTERGRISNHVEYVSGNGT